jgi:hypothetical protein
MIEVSRSVILLYLYWYDSVVSASFMDMRLPILWAGISYFHIYVESTVAWDVTPCSSEKSRHFEDTHHLHLQSGRVS